MIKHICKTCGKEFFNERTVYAYCSRKCAGIAHSKFMSGKPSWNTGKKCPQLSKERNWNWKGGVIEKTCQVCNKSFKVYPYRNKTAKYCSKQCSDKMNLPHFGSKNPMWKNGQYKREGGYVMVLKPNHPFCDSRGYIRRSRVIMEQKLGRYITPQEVVHHINKVKDDDRPENVELFSNHSNHMKYHYPKSKLKTINISLRSSKIRRSYSSNST